MNKRYLIGITGILLFGFFAGVWQYLETINLETVSAVTVGTPDPGHAWLSMECSATSLCVDVANNRLGIGTNIPQANIHINNNGPRILLFDTDTAIGAANPAYSVRAQNDGLFKIQSTVDYAAYTDRLTIDSVGNLGIGTATPATRLHVGDGGDGAANGITVRSTYPTIYLRDTDQRSGMIHMNGNSMYFLRGSGTDSAGWATYNGQWPLYLNLENNDAVFGGNVVANVGAFYGQNSTGSGDVLFIGNDSKIADINVGNTAGLYGAQDSSQGGLKLGSGGATIYGANGKLGVGTQSPAQALEVSGNILASGDVCNAAGACLSQITAYAGSQPLIGAIHTLSQCTAAGGTVVDIGAAYPLCRFSGASCPGGWTWYNNWSTTSANTCNSSSRCDGVGIVYPWNCNTGSHAWSSNAGIESCTYYPDCGWDHSCCSSTCYASRSQVGCY